MFPSPTEMLVYLTAGGSSGLFLWSFYGAYDEVMKRSELNPERRVWIRSILFRILIPFSQPFAAIFTLWADRLARREMETLLRLESQEKNSATAGAAAREPRP